MSTRLITWLLSRPARERVMLAVLIAIVLPIAIVVGVALPLRDAHSVAQHRLKEMEELQHWVVERVIEKSEIPQASAMVNVAEPIGSSGLEKSLIDANLRTFVTTLSMRDDGIIDLAFDAVTFTTLSNWLSATKNNWGYDVTSFRFEAGAASGKIKANMTLTPRS
ncbi:MAG: general secretion pathway protein M [Candidatus Azotimanducaceae bacterium]|jgi:general secretion pathway protein M